MKNLLIISHNVMGNSNNGKAISSFLNSVDFSKIHQLYFYKQLPNDNNIIESYYRITDSDIIKTIFNGLSFRYSGKNLTYQASKTNTISINNKRSARALKKYLKSPITVLARDLIWGFMKYSGSNLESWINSITPGSLLVLMSDSVFSLDIAISIAKKNGVNLTLFITDDYLLNYPEDSLINRHQKKRLLARIYQMLSIDTEFIFLSKNLMKIYKSEFGVSNSRLFFMNFVSNNKINERIVINYYGKIIISYTGNLSLGRDKMILNFISYMTKKSPNYKLLISSLETPKRSFIKKLTLLKNVEYVGMLSKDENDELLQNSHFGLHVENFKSEYMNITKYSISTKIYDYLKSTLPIIGYGPSLIESMQFINENGIGVTSERIEELFDFIEDNRKNRFSLDRIIQNQIKLLESQNQTLKEHSNEI